MNEEALKLQLQPYLTCNHQWFEIKKLSKYSDNGKKRVLEAKKMDEDFIEEHGHIQGFGGSFVSTDMWGILIKCANCELQKELWENENEH